jgi:hypothetical protein
MCTPLKETLLERNKKKKNYTYSLRETPLWGLLTWSIGVLFNLEHNANTKKEKEKM